MSEELQAEIDRLRKKIAQLYEGAEEQRQRIKRLEEAGDAMEVYCDAIAAHNWNKAKEAKL